MWICIVKETKRIIEMQDPGAAGGLLENAVNAGYAIEDIEEKKVDALGYLAAQAEDPIYIAVANEKDKDDRIREAILAKFPTRQSVADTIDAAPNTIAALKAICKSGFDALYLHVTNKES